MANAPQQQPSAKVQLAYWVGGTIAGWLWFVVPVIVLADPNPWVRFFLSGFAGMFGSQTGVTMMRRRYNKQ